MACHVSRADAEAADVSNAVNDAIAESVPAIWTRNECQREASRRNDDVAASLDDGGDGTGKRDRRHDGLRLYRARGRKGIRDGAGGVGPLISFP
jgi:hypothetical protein